jgi:hypothetical protein
MNIKAIIASLVLGSSSVAMATPSVTVTATAQGAYDTTIIRDHRGDDSPAATQPAIQPTYRREGWHGGGWDGEGMLPPVYASGGWNGQRMPPVYRPVTLASGLHFANQGRTFITVGSQAGRFETLQISAAGGPTFIQQVYVQFDNGQEQIVRNLDRRLTANESLTLDLDGNRRAIRRIVVYGSDLTWGRRQIAGAVTVTAA